MWPILFCSVAALTLALKKWAAYRAVDRKLSAPAGDIARAETGPMIALVRALRRGADERELSLVGTRQVRELERGLGLLSLISVITPILGLTGTVTGMIQTFQSISSLGSAVDPALLASGIWEALITTAAGLLVAIPAHVAYHLLDERLGEITQRMKEVTFELQKETPRGI